MYTFNFLAWALGKVIAEQRGDSGADSSRLALPALLLPSTLGILFAVMEARRFEPAATKPVSTPTSGSSSSQSGLSSSSSGSGSSSSGSSSSGSSSSGSSSSSPSASSMSSSGTPSSSSSSSSSSRHHKHDTTSELHERGKLLLESTPGLGKRPHEFFPSFIGLNYIQAAELARLMKLTIEPSEEQEGRVNWQDPPPGARWARTKTDVDLDFGRTRGSDGSEAIN